MSTPRLVVEFRAIAESLEDAQCISRALSDAMRRERRGCTVLVYRDVVEEAK